MSIRWEALTVDARDPAALARWWAETLGWDVVAHDAGTEVRPPEGRGAVLFFIGVDEVKQAKNRLHLDLSADDPAAAVDGLLARGATHVDVGQPAEGADVVVLGDPEGNEFCVLTPH